MTENIEAERLPPHRFDSSMLAATATVDPGGKEEFYRILYVLFSKDLSSPFFAFVKHASVTIIQNSYRLDVETLGIAVEPASSTPGLP